MWRTSVTEVGAAAVGHHVRCRHVALAHRHVHALTERRPQWIQKQDAAAGVLCSRAGLDAGGAAEVAALREAVVTLECLALKQSCQEEDGTSCSLHHSVCEVNTRRI